MSLPLSYRPRAVVELIEEEQKSSLKMTVSKKDLFMEALFGWHGKLTKREKSLLTKKKLIARAIHEAHKLQLPYKSIPSDWMQRMVKERGLVCFISRRALARRAARQNNRTVVASVSPETKSPDGDTDEAKPRRKTLIDLTSEEPPEEWTKAKEAGQAPPRFLSTCATETEVIRYWDYDLSHWKLDNGMDPSKLLVIPPPMRAKGSSLVYNSWET